MQGKCEIQTLSADNAGPLPPPHPTHTTGLFIEVKRAYLGLCYWTSKIHSISVRIPNLKDVLEGQLLAEKPFDPFGSENAKNCIYELQHFLDRQTTPAGSLFRLSDNFLVHTINSLGTHYLQLI